MRARPRGAAVASQDALIQVALIQVARLGE